MTKELFTCTEYTMPMAITPGALRETYVRSWRKRLFSRPEGERCMEVHFCDKSHLDPHRERFPAFDNEGRCAHCGKVVDDETIRNTVGVHLEIHDEIVRQEEIKRRLAMAKDAG